MLAGPGVAARSTAAYIMTLGCRVPDGTAIDAFDADAAEQLIDTRTDEEIVLEVAAPTMRRVGGADRAMVEFREAEFRKQGVVYPDVRVVLTDDRPGSVRLRLNDVTLPVRQLGADAGWADVVRYVGAELASRRYWFVRTARCGASHGRRTGVCLSGSRRGRQGELFACPGDRLYARAGPQQ